MTVPAVPIMYVRDGGDAPTVPAGVRVLMFDLTESVADPVGEFLTAGICRLFELLRALLEPVVTADAIVVVVEIDRTPPEDRWPVIEAAFAAAQATVHSLSLEHPRARLTVVRTTPDSRGELQSTVEFLATSGGAYVTAATIDLRSAS